MVPSVKMNDTLFAMKYVYVLKDPRDGEIRYVGATTNCPRGRRKAHMDRATNGRTRKNAWLFGLKQVDMIADVSVVECGEWTLDELAAAETWWIEHLRNTGHHLVNQVNGGNGWRGSMFRHSAETRAQMSATRRGKKLNLTAEQRARWGNRQPRTVEQRARISATLKNNPQAVAQALANVAKMADTNRGRSWSVERRTAASLQHKTQVNQRDSKHKMWRTRNYNRAVELGRVLPIEEVTYG